MPPPSPLAIATSSLQRLMKEEASYHKELKHQEARLEKLLASKDEDENAEYSLKQEVRSSLFPILDYSDSPKFEEWNHRIWRKDWGFGWSVAAGAKLLIAG